MVVRDQDLDFNIVCWGLHHLLDSAGAAPSPHCAVCPQTPTTDYAPPLPQTLHALLDDARGGSGHCAHRPQPPTTDYAPQPQTAEVRVDAVENDEVIAHALQEELAQVAMAEAEGGASSCSAHAVLAQQWIRPEFVSHLPSAPPYVEEQQEAAEGRISVRARALKMTMAKAAR